MSIIGNTRDEHDRPAAFFNEMGVEWHSDSAGYENLDGVTFLYALQVPPVGGELVKQVDNMSEAASTDYVMALVAHATHPERVYNPAWRPGDLVLWDNRAMMHSATDVDIYRSATRVMHRSYSFTGPRALPGGRLASAKGD